MPDLLPYQYVVMRCVPRVEREEFVNVGVVLYSQAADLLQAAWHVDTDRVQALFPALDVTRLCDALGFVEGVCAGDDRGGAAAAQSPGQRFGFLKAPRSTVLQPGPVHGGLAADPRAELERLLDRLVR